MAADQPLYDEDARRTLDSRRRLQDNGNLLLWYRTLYDDVFDGVGSLAGQRVLEIGSGASPLKALAPDVVTSDVLALDHLDLVFDCHRIDEVAGIEDRSLDVITLTNVLHHLRDPLLFLRLATRKLKPGGTLYVVEPYFSVLSRPVYRFLHHEPVDFTIARPRLQRVDGPLSTSNQAMPYLVFFGDRGWLEELGDVYALDRTEVRFHTALAYFLTGGISRRFPVPQALYRLVLRADRWLARRWPRAFASFFSARLVARSPS